MQDLLAAALLLATTLGFVVIGIRRGRSPYAGLDDYLVARNSYGAGTGAATLLASSFGAWLLFSPSEAATWGGAVALVGYGLGVAAPRLALIPLGLRMRHVMPNGRSLAEYVRVRFGAGLYAAVLVVMITYLAIVIAAEATATARVMSVVSDLPAWLPAGITLAASVLYTGIGGLRASVVTDRAQMVVIAPFLALLLVIGVVIVWNAGGPAAMAATVPDLLELGNANGLQFAGALFLAILFTGVLHQGNWQRVFAMESPRAVKRSMAWAALISAPVVALVGLFGLAHEMLGLDTPSAALFAVLETGLPMWLLSLVAVLAVALVLSSMDTALNALASLTVVALRTARPHWPVRRLVRLSIGAMILAALAALGVAVQGWSVLYLFLCADLLCAATSVPVFAGLFLRRYDGRLALASLGCGLAAGIWQFPAPDMAGGSLVAAFALAAGVPLLMTPLCLLRPARFDLARLKTEVSRYAD